MHRFQNCFRFLSTTFRYVVTFYACHTRTRIKRNSVTKSRRSKTKTVLKSVHFQKILELSNSHLVNIQYFFSFLSIVLKCVKVKCQCSLFFFQDRPWVLRVIGLKLAGKLRPIFEFFYFLTFAFYPTPLLRGFSQYL